MSAILAPPLVHEGRLESLHYTVTPVFQPIVDLKHGVAAGFEVLSRGPAPWSSPEGLFERARESGTIWELERACRLAALSAIAALPPALRSSHSFFLNVSPDVIDDPRFVSGDLDDDVRPRETALLEGGARETERASIRDASRVPPAMSER